MERDATRLFALMHRATDATNTTRGGTRGWVEKNGCGLLAFEKKSRPLKSMEKFALLLPPFLISPTTDFLLDATLYRLFLVSRGGTGEGS